MTDRRPSRIMAILLAVGMVLAMGLPSARGQQVATVTRGVEYLRRTATTAGAGEAALATLAMLKAEVPPNDPGVAAGLRKLNSVFSGSSYSPDRKGGSDIYEAAVIIMAFANHDANAHKAQIKSLSDYLVSRQKAAGGWDYDTRSYGDCSISQYAVLGLWEAENAGITISPRVWDNAAAFYIGAQSAGGSWNYHRDENAGGDSISMTAAGVGSLLICQKQLSLYRHVAVEQRSPLLIPIQSEGKREQYTIKTSPARLAQAIRSGLGWISTNFTTTDNVIIGQSPYYALYGIERVGALAGRDSLGKVDWFEVGAQFLASKQGPDGSFTSQHGEVPNTAWAVLFLTKSTAKTIERIRVKRLGGGEMLGGKGLPKDLSSISEAGGRLVTRPMDGAIEGMLTVLEDPRTENADAALAGLIERYRKDGARALFPSRDRFQKLLGDRDPGVRKVAVWAIARMDQLALIPLLVEALKDPDAAVVNEARVGLQLLSRKIDGYGPGVISTPEERVAAAKAWKAWYESVRPVSVDDGDTGKAFSGSDPITKVGGESRPQ